MIVWKAIARFSACGISMLSEHFKNRSKNLGGLAYFHILALI